MTSAPALRAPPAAGAAGRSRRVVDLVPAARLRRGRPLWVLVGLLLGFTAGGGAVVLITLHQPVVQARAPFRPPAGPSLPSGGQASQAAGPAAAARSPGGRTGAGPVVTQVPAAAGTLPAPAMVPTAAPAPEPSPAVDASPTPARREVLYSGSGTLVGAACVPADCSSLTSPTGHVQYQLGHTSCGTDTVITLTLTSESANKSTFTVSDTGSTGLISGQAAPFHATGPFSVGLRTTSPCSYDLTLRS